jgi:hypothetical protein
VGTQQLSGSWIDGETLGKVTGTMAACMTTSPHLAAGPSGNGRRPPGGIRAFIIDVSEHIVVPIHCCHTAEPDGTVSSRVMPFIIS